MGIIVKNDPFTKKRGQLSVAGYNVYSLPFVVVTISFAYPNGQPEDSVRTAPRMIPSSVANIVTPSKRTLVYKKDWLMVAATGFETSVSQSFANYEDMLSNNV